MLGSSFAREESWNSSNTCTCTSNKGSRWMMTLFISPHTCTHTLYVHIPCPTHILYTYPFPHTHTHCIHIPSHTHTQCIYIHTHMHTLYTHPLPHTHAPSHTVHTSLPYTFLLTHYQPQHKQGQGYGRRTPDCFPWPRTHSAMHRARSLIHMDLGGSGGGRS